MSKKILVCGESVFMVGLAASLLKRPELLISQADELDCDQTFLPDLILVEMHVLEEFDILARLQACPGVPLLGVDYNASTLTSLSGKFQPVSSLEELVTCLLAAADPGPPDLSV